MRAENWGPRYYDGPVLHGRAIPTRALDYLDRGNHIRTPTEYDQLAAATFSKRHGVISKNTGWALPGTGFILECLA